MFFSLFSSHFLFHLSSPLHTLSVFSFMNSEKSEVVLLMQNFGGPCSPVCYHWFWTMPGISGTCKKTNPENRRIIIKKLVPFNNYKGKLPLCLSAAAFGPTSSDRQVLDKMEKEQANTSSWLALLSWLHKAYATHEHFGRLVIGIVELIAI